MRMFGWGRQSLLSPQTRWCLLICLPLETLWDWSLQLADHQPEQKKNLRLKPSFKLSFIKWVAYLQRTITFRTWFWIHCVWCFAVDWSQDLSMAVGFRAAPGIYNFWTERKTFRYPLSTFFFAYKSVLAGNVIFGNYLQSFFYFFFFIIFLVGKHLDGLVTTQVLLGQMDKISDQGKIRPFLSWWDVVTMLLRLRGHACNQKHRNEEKVTLSGGLQVWGPPKT